MMYFFIPVSVLGIKILLAQGVLRIVFIKVGMYLFCCAMYLSLTIEVKVHGYVCWEAIFLMVAFVVISEVLL